MAGVWPLRSGNEEGPQAVKLRALEEKCRCRGGVPGEGI